MKETIDIDLRDDGSEIVVSGINKYRNFLATIFMNDSCDIERNLTGTVINEPTYGFNLERLMFSIGNHLTTPSYLQTKIKNAVNMTPNTEMRIISPNAVNIQRDTSIGRLKLSITVNGIDVDLI